MKSHQKTSLCVVHVASIPFFSGVIMAMACSKPWTIDWQVIFQAKNLHSVRGFPSQFDHLWMATHWNLHLVGGWATPLKKIRVRQLGSLFHSQLIWKNKSHVPVTTNQSAILVVSWVIGLLPVIHFFSWDFPAMFDNTGGQFHSPSNRKSSKPSGAGSALSTWPAGSWGSPGERNWNPLVMSK